MPPGNMVYQSEETTKRITNLRKKKSPVIDTNHGGLGGWIEKA